MRQRELEVLSAKPRKRIPHEFVVEAIAALRPVTRPLFSCVGVYVEDKIVFALRDKPNATEDNGVWLATTLEHHESLLLEFPNMRSIGVLGKPITGWQVLPTEAADFESAALRACELVLSRDPRIGKVPKARAKKAKVAAHGAARPAKQFRGSSR